MLLARSRLVQSSQQGSRETQRTRATIPHLTVSIGATADHEHTARVRRRRQSRAVPGWPLPRWCSGSFPWASAVAGRLFIIVCGVLAIIFGVRTLKRSQGFALTGIISGAVAIVVAIVAVNVRMANDNDARGWGSLRNALVDEGLADGEAQCVVTRLQADHGEAPDPDRAGERGHCSGGNPGMPRRGAGSIEPHGRGDGRPLHRCEGDHA